MRVPKSSTLLLRRRGGALGGFNQSGVGGEERTTLGAGNMPFSREIHLNIRRVRGEKGGAEHEGSSGGGGWSLSLKKLVIKMYCGLRQSQKKSRVVGSKRGICSFQLPWVTLERGKGTTDLVPDSGRT